MIRKVFAGTVVLTLLVVGTMSYIMLFAPKDPWKGNGSCSGTFKAWKSGAVTVLQPHLAKKCSKIFKRDAEEVTRVLAESANWKNSLSDQQFLSMTTNCSWVRYYFNNNLYVTDLEKSFPIGFTVVSHNSPQQVVRLLKVLYRPHNQYCLAPDLKSNSVFKDILSNIAGCMDNVHVVPKLIPVIWGHHSIMDVQMNCLKHLLDLREHQLRKWNYVINLCGKELPLATNHEIVSHLVKLNGSTAILPRRISKDDNRTNSRLRGKRIPFNLPYYKSMTYIGVSYDFAHFIFTNSTAIAVSQFFKECDHSEEHFYAVLATIPGVPGGLNTNIPAHKQLLGVSYCIWQHNGKMNHRCSGKIVHSICIPKIGDLAGIMRETRNGSLYFFHNKYFMDYDHTLMDCMEEELIARNKREFEEENCIIGQSAVYHE